MKKLNAIEMKGRLYDQNLDTREADDGSTAIFGTITLEVDEKGTQVVIRFYAKPRYKNGKPNRTYGILEDIMNGEYRTVAIHQEDADWLSVTGNVDVSYFIGNTGAKSPEEMAISQQLRGAFINPNRKHEYCNKWKLDMLVTGVTEMEADPEKGFERHARVFGYCIDGFRERLLNISFDARSEAAINFVLGLTCSTKEPMFLPTWGALVKVGSRKVVKNMISGGDDDIVESERLRWVLVGVGNPYTFGDPSDISAEDYETYRKALADYKEERFNELREDTPVDDNLAF